MYELENKMKKKIGQLILGLLPAMIAALMWSASGLSVDKLIFILVGIYVLWGVYL